MRRHVATGITLRVMTAAVLIAAAAFAVFANTPAAEPASQAASAQPLTVIATWTGPEGNDFQEVLQAFKKKTGIHVDYTGTRALDQLLASDILQGNPPDLAILPNPATLLQYLSYLTPLDGVIGKQQISAYGPQWQDIMRLGTGKLYALPFKTQVRNLVWYDPRNWPDGSPRFAESAPPTWSQLIALITAHGGTPWCVGLDSTPVSGWPATDWIGDILLHQAGTKAYEQWANGELSWTSPQVRAAWQAWGNLVRSGQVYGGTEAALVTAWDKAGMQMFGLAPGCYLQHAPSFITLPYQQDASRPKPGAEYDFFPFPMAGLPDQTEAANDAWEVSADLLAMFHPTPEAQSLVKYLASEPAQQIWPGIPGGGATSANLDVPPSTYPDRVEQAIAAMVTNKQATLCFNASDEMPDALQNDFYQGVMEYLQDPGQLRAILGKLDQVRKTTYSLLPGETPDFSNFSCGSP